MCYNDASRAVTYTPCLNAQKRSALQAHRARRDADKASIMSIVAAGGVGEARRVQLGMSDLAIAMDCSTSRLLSYVNFCDGLGDRGVVRCPLPPLPVSLLNCPAPASPCCAALPS